MKSWLHDVTIIRVSTFAAMSCTRGGMPAAFRLNRLLRSSSRIGAAGRAIDQQPVADGRRAVLIAVVRRERSYAVVEGGIGDLQPAPVNREHAGRNATGQIPDAQLRLKEVRPAESGQFIQSCCHRSRPFRLCGRQSAQQSAGPWSRRRQLLTGREGKRRSAAPTPDMSPALSGDSLASPRMDGDSHEFPPRLECVCRNAVARGFARRKPQRIYSTSPSRYCRAKSRGRSRRWKRSGSAFSAHRAIRAPTSSASPPGIRTSRSSR